MLKRNGEEKKDKNHIENGKNRGRKNWEDEKIEKKNKRKGVSRSLRSLNTKRFGSENQKRDGDTNCQHKL